MTDNEKVTGRLIVNPASAVVLADEAFRGRKPASAKEDWVLLNADLIKNIGAAAWLDELLDVLSLAPADYDGHDIINPTLAITISENLRVTPQARISRDKWIEANAKLINELDATEWLWLLLDVLETGRA